MSCCALHLISQPLIRPLLVQTLAGIMNASSARCWSSDCYNPHPGVMENVPSSNGYAGGFATVLMEKDLYLALQVTGLGNVII